MSLAPFGVLNDEQKTRLAEEGGIYKPMKAWPAGEAPAFRSLVENWLNDVTEKIWPAWENRAWVGGAAATMEAATRDELALAVRLYHGGGNAPGILAEVPDIPPAPDGHPRTQEWHYKIEDALVHDQHYFYWKLPSNQETSYNFQASGVIGSNYIVYDPDFDGEEFSNLFWGRMASLEPPTISIKQLLQRPRPWTAATALGVDGFRWTVAGGSFATHTGIHPSFISGHCIQGILGGCSVFDALLGDGGAIDAGRIRAIQKYMVDWGDRRVFAGVHHMTDNIGSWTLARRLIPRLFRNARRVESLAVQAITQHSRVFGDIVAHFDENNPARAMLLADFPEALAVS